MHNPENQSPPTSPHRASSIPSNTGSPTTVPFSQDNDSDSSRQLEHGTHDAKGGDDGNEYQAMWMTLACTNALYQQRLQPNAPKVREIILEGSREPFDDIEIRKKDDSLTLFQSKHRNVKGSGNILISELVKDPDGKIVKDSDKTEKKVKDAAPFSLLKYFRGMMKIINSNVIVEKTRFILCASAPFSTIYTNEHQINLGKNFWETSGILQDIEEERLESLLANIIYHDNNKTIRSYFEGKNIKPKYVRFSDKFVNDKLTGDAKQLRNYLWETLDTFINKNRKAKNKWVTWKEKENNEKIALFFRNLQWWIEQPKLTHLDEVVKHQLRCNFQLAADDIQNDILKAIRQSSEKSEESLVVKNIEGFFRCARGRVLAKYLAVESFKYKKRYYLDSFMSATSTQNQLTQFLESKINVGVISCKNNEDLKFFVHTALSQHYGHLKPFGENWLIVHAQTAPIYDCDKVSKKEFNHEPEDLIDSKSFDLIVLDSAEILPESAYGNQMLVNLLTRIKKGDTSTKLILISSPNVDWKSYLIKNNYTIKEFEPVNNFV